MSEIDEGPYRIPTEAEVTAAELRLGMSFHADYREFLLGGGDVVDAKFEPAVVVPNSGHLDLFEVASSAWNLMGVPRDLLPFVEDNGDYFCITAKGEVVYWSHNGSTDEKWASIAMWKQQVCVERSMKVRQRSC